MSDVEDLHERGGDQLDGGTDYDAPASHAGGSDEEHDERPRGGDAEEAVPPAGSAQGVADMDEWAAAVASREESSGREAPRAGDGEAAGDGADGPSEGDDGGTPRHDGGAEAVAALHADVDAEGSAAEADSDECRAAPRVDDVIHDSSSRLEAPVATPEAVVAHGPVGVGVARGEPGAAAERPPGGDGLAGQARPQRCPSASPPLPHRGSRTAASGSCVSQHGGHPLHHVDDDGSSAAAGRLEAGHTEVELTRSPCDSDCGSSQEELFGDALVDCVGNVYVCRRTGAVKGFRLRVPHAKAGGGGGAAHLSPGPRGQPRVQATVLVPRSLHLRDGFQWLNALLRDDVAGFASVMDQRNRAAQAISAAHTTDRSASAKGGGRSSSSGSDRGMDQEAVDEEDGTNADEHSDEGLSGPDIDDMIGDDAQPAISRGESQVSSVAPPRGSRPVDSVQRLQELASGGILISDSSQGLPSEPTPKTSDDGESSVRNNSCTLRGEPSCLHGKNVSEGGESLTVGADGRDPSLQIFTHRFPDVNRRLYVAFHTGRRRWYLLDEHPKDLIWFNAQRRCKQQSAGPARAASTRGGEGEGSGETDSAAEDDVRGHHADGIRDDEGGAPHSAEEEEEVEEEEEEEAEEEDSDTERGTTDAGLEDHEAPSPGGDPSDEDASSADDEADRGADAEDDEAVEAAGVTAGRHGGNRRHVGLPAPSAQVAAGSRVAATDTAAGAPTPQADAADDAGEADWESHSDRGDELFCDDSCYDPLHVIPVDAVLLSAIFSPTSMLKACLLQRRVNFEVLEDWLWRDLDTALPVLETVISTMRLLQQQQFRVPKPLHPRRIDFNVFFAPFTEPTSLQSASTFAEGIPARGVAAMSATNPGSLLDTSSNRGIITSSHPNRSNNSTMLMDSATKGNSDSLMSTTQIYEGGLAAPENAALKATLVHRMLHQKDFFTSLPKLLKARDKARLWMEKELARQTGKASMRRMKKRQPGEPRLTAEEEHLMVSHYILYPHAEMTAITAPDPAGQISSWRLAPYSTAAQALMEDRLEGVLEDLIAVGILPKGRIYVSEYLRTPFAMRLFIFLLLTLPKSFLMSRWIVRGEKERVGGKPFEAGQDESEDDEQEDLLDDDGEEPQHAGDDGDDTSDADGDDSGGASWGNLREESDDDKEGAADAAADRAKYEVERRRYRISRAVELVLRRALLLGNATLGDDDVSDGERDDDGDASSDEAENDDDDDWVDGDDSDEEEDDEEGGEDGDSQADHDENGDSVEQDEESDDEQRSDDRLRRHVSRHSYFFPGGFLTAFGSSKNLIPPRPSLPKLSRQEQRENRLREEWVQAQKERLAVFLSPTVGRVIVDIRKRIGRELLLRRIAAGLVPHASAEDVLALPPLTSGRRKLAASMTWTMESPQRLMSLFLPPVLGHSAELLADAFPRNSAHHEAARALDPVLTTTFIASYAALSPRSQGPASVPEPLPSATTLYHTDIALAALVLAGPLAERLYARAHARGTNSALRGAAAASWDGELETPAASAASSAIILQRAKNSASISDILGALLERRGYTEAMISRRRAVSRNGPYSSDSMQPIVRQSLYRLVHEKPIVTRPGGSDSGQSSEGLFDVILGVLPLVDQSAPSLHRFLDHCPLFTLFTGVLHGAAGAEGGADRRVGAAHTPRVHSRVLPDVLQTVAQMKRREEHRMHLEQQWSIAPQLGFVSLEALVSCWGVMIRGDEDASSRNVIQATAETLCDTFWSELAYYALLFAAAQKRIVEGNTQVEAAAVTSSPTLEFRGLAVYPMAAMKTALQSLRLPVVIREAVAARVGQYQGLLQHLQRSAMVLPSLSSAAAQRQKAEAAAEIAAAVKATQLQAPAARVKGVSGSQPGRAAALPARTAAPLSAIVNISDWNMEHDILFWLTEASVKLQRQALEEFLGTTTMAPRTLASPETLHALLLELPRPMPVEGGAVGGSGLNAVRAGAAKRREGSQKLAFSISAIRVLMRHFRVTVVRQSPFEPEECPLELVIRSLTALEARARPHVARASVVTGNVSNNDVCDQALIQERKRLLTLLEVLIASGMTLDVPLNGGYTTAKMWLENHSAPRDTDALLELWTRHQAMLQADPKQLAGILRLVSQT